MTEPNDTFTRAAIPAVAYLRVSTAEQGKSGLGLDAQQAAIAQFCEREGFAVGSQHWYTEVVGGNTTEETLSDRPQLQAALAASKAAGMPLLVAKLDRLSRNSHFINGLMEHRVQFIVTELGVSNDPFVLRIYAALAQKERELIGQRSKAAQAQLKERLGTDGFIIGKKSGVKRTRLGSASPQWGALVNKVKWAAVAKGATEAEGKRLGAEAVRAAKAALEQGQGANNIYSTKGA